MANIKNETLAIQLMSALRPWCIKEIKNYNNNIHRVKDIIYP